MASMDLDPVFSRALRLLHSKSKDSEDQLRSMLDEAIKQRHGSNKTLANIFVKKEIVVKRDSSKTVSPPSNPRKDELQKESEIKNFDKIEESSKNTTPSPSQNDDNDDGLALEILEEDLTCVVCREMDVVARNRLVECAECHSLYHQECHQPPVAEAEINEPQSEWYCANCAKFVSKLGSQRRTNAAPLPFNTIGGRPAVSILAPRTTSVPTSTPSSTSSKSFGGLPQPAPKTKSSTLAVSSSQKCVMPNINIISADKRLQIMKKKAAKMQEKRKHSK